MSKYLLHWLDGKTETLEGDTITDAMRQAGIGAGAVPAIDYWEEIKEENSNE